MKNLVKTDFDLVLEELNSLYEDAPQHKQADYMSPMLEEFVKKVEAIVKVFNCSLEDVNFTKRGEWQASVDISSLDDDERQKFEFKLKELKTNDYKKLQFYHPKKPGPNENPDIGVIQLHIGSVQDNTWTAQDLDDYFITDTNDEKRTAARNKLNALVSRMFRYSGQTENPEIRIAGYKFAKDYEDELSDMFNGNNKDIGISGLHLSHENTIFSLAPDRKTDFTGRVQVPQKVIAALSDKYSKKDKCNIDGKSGGFEGYVSPCDKNFAKYFLNKVRSGGFGSLHNADYILFVNKYDNKVICINVANPIINGEVGTITKSKYPLPKEAASDAIVESLREAYYSPFSLTYMKVGIDDDTPFIDEKMVYAKALQKLIRLLETLSSDQKDCLGLVWMGGDNEANEEGDCIMSIYSPKELADSADPSEGYIGDEESISPSDAQKILSFFNR